MHIMFTFISTATFCTLYHSYICVVVKNEVKVILYLPNSCLFSPLRHWQKSEKHIPVYVQFHENQELEE